MLRRLWLKFVQWAARRGGLQQERAHHFYAEALCSDSQVVDLGAHRGEFARYIATTYGATILGLEANPDLFADLPSLPRTRFLNLAISEKNCPVEFHISSNPEASSVIAAAAHAGGRTRPVRVQGITLDQLWQDEKLKVVDLLKVDIESAEFRMLEQVSDATLVSIAQITVEFHLGSPSSEFTKERFLQISRRLKRLGFATYSMDRNYTDVLFLNSAHVTPTFSQRIALAIYRYIVMGVRSILDREAKQPL